MALPTMDLRGRLMHNAIMTAPHPTPVPVPAATLVVFRRAADGGPPELLMVERSAGMRFAAGAAVFPGGRIDPADHELAELAVSNHLPRDEAAARIAAIRETLEEAGLMVGVTEPVTAGAAAQARAALLNDGRLGPVLAQFGWTLDLDQLVPFARWCPNHHRAFDTRFYLADLGAGVVETLVDGTENSRIFWSSARDTLTAAGRGELHIIFPTRRNLERLALHDDFAAAAAQARAHPVSTITPYGEERNGEPWWVIPDGQGYPVTGEPLATALHGLKRT